MDPRKQHPNHTQSAVKLIPRGEWLKKNVNESMVGVSRFALSLQFMPGSVCAKPILQQIAAQLTVGQMMKEYWPVYGDADNMMVSYVRAHKPARCTPASP